MCITCSQTEKEAREAADRLIDLGLNPAADPGWQAEYLRRLDAICTSAEPVSDGVGTNPLGGRTLSSGSGAEPVASSLVE